MSPMTVTTPNTARQPTCSPTQVLAGTPTTAPRLPPVNKAETTRLLLAPLNSDAAVVAINDQNRA